MAKKIYLKLKPGIQKVSKKREIYLKPAKSIVILGDNGCRPPTRKSISVFKKNLKIKTDAFIILGDLVLNGQSDEFRELLRFCKKRVNVPIFTLAGNHDLPGFSEFFGLSTYAIILNDFVFVFLDNSRKKFIKKELHFLARELKKHKNKKFFILFHVPPSLEADRSRIQGFEWEKVKEVMDKFKDRIVCIFCGHIHAFSDFYLDGYRIFISGGGGATLFNLGNGCLNLYHAIRLNFINEGRINFNLIPVDKGIPKATEKYLDMRLT